MGGGGGGSPSLSGLPDRPSRSGLASRLSRSPRSGHGRHRGAFVWCPSKAHGFLPNTVNRHDDAGLFNVGHRPVRGSLPSAGPKLDTFTDQQRGSAGAKSCIDLAVLSRSQSLSPASHRRLKAALRASVRRHLHAQGPACRHCLDRCSPAFQSNRANCSCCSTARGSPCSTNGSENDIRCHVTKRKVSRRPRSRPPVAMPRRLPRPQQDRAKLGIAFWTTWIGSVSKPPYVPALPQSTSTARHSVTATTFAPLTNRES